MPIFDFKCPSCGTEATRLVMGEYLPDAIKCTNCWATMEKVPSVPASPIIRGFNAANGYSGKGDN